MRRIGMKSMALALAAGGLVLVRGDLRAAGTINTSGATITVGDASIRGAVTIDAAADLGNVPALSNALVTSGYVPQAYRGAYPFNNDRGRDRFVHAGLGGPAFRAQVDMTLPGGTYDYGSLTVDPGVTVTFTGPATIRTTNEMHVEGRIVLAGSGALTLDCAGDFAMIGSTGSVPCGLYADEDDSTILVAVGGVLSVSAPCDYAHFHATGIHGGIGLLCDKRDSELRTTIENAAFDAHADEYPGDYPSDDGWIYVSVGDGYLTLTNCTFTGPVAYVAVSDADMPQALNDDVLPTELTIDGGTFAGLDLYAHWGIHVSGAVASGGRAVAIRSYQGPVVIDGNSGGPSSLDAVETAGVSGQSVEIAVGCDVRTTGVSGTSVYPVGLSAYDHVTIADGATVADTAGRGVTMSSNGPVDVSGTVQTAAGSVTISSAGADVSIGSGSTLSAPNGSVILYGQGAVTASGGTASLSAQEYDVRCVTGDLDLDVGTMSATTGRIVAMSNGTVRLRGTYQAARDVQVISLLDAIDVHGATLETTDAGAAPSGFVRLATYAATSIDASDSTLATGSSETQSGDILIQTQQSGSVVVEGLMKTARVSAKRTGDVVVTKITGKISARNLKKLGLVGSGRVTAGSISRRLMMAGGGTKFSGADGVVDLRLSSVGKSGATFTLTIRETSATAGERVALRFERAGFHAKGSFKRPKAK